MQHNSAADLVDNNSLRMSGQHIVASGSPEYPYNSAEMLQAHNDL
jgi:hypothetical protein